MTRAIICCYGVLLTIFTLASSDTIHPDIDLPIDNSGWRIMNNESATLLGLDFEHCTIDRIPASEMTIERFQTEYLGKKPCVLSNLTDSWAARKLWSKSYFVSKFGNRNVEVDKTKVFESYGGSKTLKTMANYIGSDFQSITTSRVLDLAQKKNTTPLQYSFYNFEDGDWEELVEESPVPLLFKFIDDTEGHVNQIAVGATGTGLSWHSHHDAWNSVVIGKKLWLIADPKGPAPAGTGLFSTDDDPHCCNALTWHIEEHRRRLVDQVKKKNVDKKRQQMMGEPEQEKKQQGRQQQQQQNHESTWDFGSQSHVHQCIVNAGEAVYVPARWAHATMNIGDTIARSQRAGSEDMDDTLVKYASSTITFDLEHSGRFGVLTKDFFQEYIHLNELLDNNALELICDTNREYGRRMRTFKFMTSIVKKVDRALKKMVRNMKTTMPSKVRNKLKVREHFQGSDMQLREYKSRMGTCYMKGDLYRSSNKKRRARAGFVEGEL